MESVVECNLYQYASNNPVNRVDLTGLADGDIRTIERQQNGTHTGDGDAFIHGFTVGVFTGLVSGIGGTVGDEETHQGLFTDFGSAVYDDPKLAKGFQAGHNVGYVASIIGAFVKGTRSSGPAEAGVTKKANPLDGTKYTDKVTRQMEGKDLDHNFPSLIDKQADAANVKKITGGDGIERTKVELPGSVNGKDGNFSWIIEPDKTVGAGDGAGKTVTLRKMPDAFLKHTNN